MPRPRFPKRGSRAFSPRKRAKKIVARIDFWPYVEEGPKLLGFAGYKAGMTHAFVIEDRERVPEFGREIRSAVTILDTPPMIICALRAYLNTGNGLQTLTEAWTENLPPDIRLRIKSLIPTTPKISLDIISSKIDEVSEIRVIAATQPRLASVSNKKPELIEIKIDGGDKKEQFEYAIFGHIGDNHLHVNIIPRNDEEVEVGMKLYFNFARKAVKLGGTVSAEHGIGKMKLQLLHEMYGEIGIQQIAAVKRALDPNWLLNPDNMIPPPSKESHF